MYFFKMDNFRKISITIDSEINKSMIVSGYPSNKVAREVSLGSLVFANHTKLGKVHPPKEKSIKAKEIEAK